MARDVYEQNVNGILGRYYNTCSTQNYLFVSKDFLKEKADKTCKPILFYISSVFTRELLTSR